MHLNIKTTTDPKVAARFLADRILKELELGKKVLWFATGGSSVPVAAEATKIISKYPHKNLTVTLTDERYGPVGHPDSNLKQLTDKGFTLPEANFISVLAEEDIIMTTKNFNVALGRELDKAGYKIGLFGIGLDGHTAGILPNTEALNSPAFAFSYKTETFERITITPKAILKLDEAVVFMQGEQKWPVLETLEEKNININEQPAQVLRQVPLLTIFTDYQK